MEIKKTNAYIFSVSYKSNKVLCTSGCNSLIGPGLIKQNYWFFTYSANLFSVSGTRPFS